MRIALVALGFTSVVAQVVLTREFVAVFYGNELSLGLILATWLIWVALGSWLTGRLAPRAHLGKGGYAVALGVVALSFPTQVALVRGLRVLLGVTPGLMIGLGPMGAAILVILAPLCLTLGYQFTLGSRLLSQGGGTVGHAYVLEALGAAIGGALFSFVLVRALDPFQITLGLGSINLLAGSWTLAFAKLDGDPRRHLRWPSMALLACGAALAVVSLPLGGRVNESTLDWQWGDVIFSQDSIYGRLTVTGRDSQRVFFQNGLLMFETQGTFPEEVAHLPLLQHPTPTTVLLIGGGASGTLREILKHPVGEVQYVELDPLVIEAARSHLPPQERSVFDDGRVTVANVDGRLYVGDTDEHFDVVIVDLPEPSTGQLNRFYTQEFFAEVADILSEDGILSLGLPSAENYLSPELRHRNGGVYHTLLSVFPHVMVLPGEHNFFFASENPLLADSAVLAKRLEERDVDTNWVNAAYLEYLFTTDRFEMTRSSLAGVEPVRLNYDLRPICYYYDMVLWLTKFYSSLRNWFYAASLLQLWWLGIPLLMLVALAWRFRGTVVPAVVALTGFAEMGIDMVVLLAFQAFRGYVFHELALITSAFMVGTATGGSVMNRLLSGIADRGSQRYRAVFALVQTAIFVYSLLLPTLMIRISDLPVPDLSFPILALLGGLLGGAEFPLAARLTTGSASRVAGVVYSSDLAGSCFGALLTSAFLIPILGIPQTCYAVAMLALAGLALLLL
jgi:spermidine synthase